MAGLGDSLSAIGGGLFQHGLTIHKQDMLTKLEKEREERADERDKAKEARAEARKAREVATTRDIQRDGKWFSVDYNSNGEVIGERAANPYDIDQKQLAQDTTKANLETILTSADINRKKLSTFDEDRSLDNQLTRARIGQANRSNTDRVDDTDRSPSALANTLIRSYDDLIRSYTTGNEPALDRSEVEELATDVIKQAALQKVDAGTLFRDELKRRAEGKQTPNALNFR